MANIVDILLRTSNSGSAAKGIGNVDRQLKSMAGTVTRLGAALGITFGVAGMVKAGKTTLDLADQMEKLERRLGISTEAMSQLKFVGEQSGVGFNTLTMGIQRMTRRVAEAAAGTGEARTALLELGLDADKLAQQEPDKMFQLIAQAMSEVPGEADRTRLAMKLFDSEGVALLQTMNEGAKGIEDLRNEAHKLGLTLSHEDAVAAAEANDAMNRLKSAMFGLSQESTINLAPSLADLANWMADKLPLAVSVSKLAFHDLMSLIFDTGGVIASFMETITRIGVMKALQLGFDDTAMALAEFAGAMEHVKETFAEKAVAEMLKRNDVLRESFDATGRKLVDVMTPATETVASQYGKLSAAAAREMIKQQDQVDQLANIFEVRLGQGTASVFDQIRANFSKMLVDMASEAATSGLRNVFGSLVGGFIGNLGSGGNAPTTSASDIFNGAPKFDFDFGASSSGSGAMGALAAGAGVVINNKYDVSGNGVSESDVRAIVDAGDRRTVTQISRAMRTGHA